MNRDNLNTPRDLQKRMDHYNQNKNQRLNHGPRKAKVLGLGQNIMITEISESMLEQEEQPKSFQL